MAPLPSIRCRRTWGARATAVCSVEQLLGRRRVEADEPEIGQRGIETMALAVPSGQQHRDRLRAEAPGDEHHGVRRAVVEPLRIVDQAQQRAFAGDVRQQRQRGEVDEERRRLAPALEPQGAAECAGLWRGKAGHSIQHRSQQLLQSGERQLRLGLDAERLEDAHVRCLLARVAEQRRLADARFATDDEHATARPAGVREQPGNGSTLRASAAEHTTSVTAGPGRLSGVHPTPNPVISPVRCPPS